MVVSRATQLKVKKTNRNHFSYSITSHAHRIFKNISWDDWYQSKTIFKEKERLNWINFSFFFPCVFISVPLLMHSLLSARTEKRVTMIRHRCVSYERLMVTTNALSVNRQKEKVERKSRKRTEQENSSIFYADFFRKEFNKKISLPKKKKF